MRLAQRIRNISASATLAITARAKQLRKEGFDVINFAAGEPDFDTPDFIKEAAIKAIKDGFTKYTPSTGTPELKTAISEKFKKDNQLNYSLDQIVVSCGAKHSLFSALQVILDNEDEVIIPSPFWVSYPEMVKLAGANPIILETEPESNFKINIKDLEKKISVRTKALILNSPSNPAGIVYTKKELAEIANVCVSSKIFVVSDEIYEKLIYDNQQHISIGALNKDIFKQTITVNGVSKTFSMTGWRIGYLGAPLELVQAIKKIQDHSTSNPASISQKAALAALNSPQDWTNKMRLEFQKRRDIMIDGLDKIKQISYIRPQGAFYVFCNIAGVGLDSVSFAKRLLDEVKVAVIPGKSFGFDNCIRLSFATSSENIIKGLEKIAEWLKQLPKKY